ncbi:MAG: polysaccharide biosynthesis protein [Campylobacterales bacterium]|nr:polysaccharide biosynthesis protein [Campylobacterales bacterium]
MNLLRPSNLKRALFFIVIDIAIFIFSTYLAYLLRFDFDIEQTYINGMYMVMFYILLVRLGMFFYLKIYFISWRHFSIVDLVRIVSVLIISSLTLIVAIYLFRDQNLVIPRSIVPMEFFIALFLIFSVRISKRMYLEIILKNDAYIPTLIIANTDKSVSIIKTLQVSNEHKYKPMLIIDDKYVGMSVNSIPVQSFAYLENTNDIFDAAIIDQSVDIQKVYPLLKKLEIEDFKVSQNYKDTKIELKNISVEDLLARHPKDLDKTVIKNFIKNKTILITGAGGSIGSEIVRQCVSFEAKKLVLVDHSEYNLYSIEQEIANSGVQVVPVMISVVDKQNIQKVFEKHKPHIVIHAAAYKHVPLCEENISQAIKNNIIGTKNIIDLSCDNGAEKVVLISTDKAVRPTNVMGTTKRICELYAQNVDSKNTEVVAVRFGNVLGSSGSVIPKFKSQLESGGPITVTHPDITRYFMLIPEACELVLQAASIGKGGEVFILDMGEPIKIVDLAYKMIELSGKKDIEVKFTGLRPGEKLYEELLIDESEGSTPYESITVAKSTFYDIVKLNSDIEKLIEFENDIEAQLEYLKIIVPEFNHMKG